MRKVHIVQLYPREMNIYGDMGNQLIARRRLEWRGIKAELSFVGPLDNIPPSANLILGGGGQDAGQSVIEKDLQLKSRTLHGMAKNGVPMLMICGMYQLFGHRFVTSEDTEIKGIGLFDMETRASGDRMIGNIIIDSAWGQLVGYENHSGKTYLSKHAHALGTVKRGAGNNDEDGLEGCHTQNVFGSYMHGPLLSKNSKFADQLLLLALAHAGIEQHELLPLDDDLERHAGSLARKRPR